MNCKNCPLDEMLWSSMLSSKDAQLKLLDVFYDEEFDLSCLDKNLKLCSLSQYDATVQILSVLEQLSTRDVITFLRKSNNIHSVTTGNIPQFSDLNVCIFGVVDSLVRAEASGVTYEQMGYLLRTEPRSRVADTKYGENQAKTAQSLGLCSIDSKHVIEPTLLGTLFNELERQSKIKVVPKLILRIPIVRNYFILDKGNQYIYDAISILKESTQKRRLSNINLLVNVVEQSLIDGI